MRVTKAQYARHRGCKPQYVSRLVREGRIKVGRDGKIDQARADAELGRKARKPKAAPAPKPHAPSSTGSLTAARARKADADAKIAELEYQERSRNLIRREEVLALHARVYANVRTRFRRLPRSLAPALAVLTAPAEIEALVLEAVDQALADLAAAPLDLPAVEGAA